MSNKRIIIARAAHYIGKRLHQTAQFYFDVFGTSSAGMDGLLPLRLDAPADFDYGLIRQGDIIFLIAAIRGCA